MNARKIAEENDDKVYQESRKKLLAFLPDSDLLNLFEQMVINRAVRAVAKNA